MVTLSCECRRPKCTCSTRVSILSFALARLLTLDADLNPQQSLTLTRATAATRAVVSDPFIAAFTAKGAVEIIVVDRSSGKLMSQPLPVVS